MKEAVVEVQSKKMLNWVKNYSLKVVFTKLMYFISAILLSGGTVLGSFYPFGLSLSGAVPSSNIVSAIFGSVLGYFMPLKFALGMRYIATVLAIAAIRWTLSDLVKIRNHVLYAPLVVFVSSMITGMAVNFAEGAGIRAVFIIILECTVAAAAAYFFDGTFKILSAKKLYMLNQKEFACVAVTAGIVMLSLSGLSVGGVCPGRIVAVLLILCVSCCMGVTGGAVMGTSMGVVLSLSSFGAAYICGAYSFGGMMAGIFSCFGKTGVCAAFAVAGILVSFRAGDPYQMIACIYEVLIAGVIFLMLPQKFLTLLKNSAPSFLGTVKYKGMREAIVQRLKLTSGCLCSITGCVEKAAFGIKDFTNPEIKNRCLTSVKAYCSGCGMRGVCWGAEKESTLSQISRIMQIVFSNEKPNKSDLPLNFMNRCGKSYEIFRRINTVKKDAYAFKAFKNHASELKVASENHFGAVGVLLNDIASDLENYIDYDEDMSYKIKSVLASEKININNTSCKKDENGKFFIEIDGDVSLKEKLTPGAFKRISDACARRLDKPFTEVMDTSCLVRLCEKKNYAVDFGVYQHSCDDGTFCGDSCRCFEDGFGRFNVIISDGMGTGGAAAVEGNIASELMKNFLKGGISFNCATKLLNSVMLFNSAEESLAAIDAVSVNLFTAEATFMKAGAPATFLVNEKEIQKLSFSSLPVGILSDVSFSCEKRNLIPGQWVIMLSDGVTDIGEQWVKELLESVKYTCACDIAKFIVNEAVKERKNTRDDDITAVVLRISNKN